MGAEVFDGRARLDSEALQGGRLMTASRKLTRARADAVAELNYARAFNAGLEAAARIVCPEGAGKGSTIAKVIMALRVPLRRKEVEVIFNRRDKLASKPQRTAAEEKELVGLRLKIEKLPTGNSPQDQMAMDLIHEAAQLLRKHHRAGK